MIASAIAGGFISQLIAGGFRWITKPRLSFQIASKIPFVIVARKDDSPTGSATWIRVRVNNGGLRNAESCRVYLTDIFRQGAKEPILKEDVMTLGASAGGDGDSYAPLSISRGFGRFFDIAYIPDDREELTIVSREFCIRTKGKTLPPSGTYEFRIAASGTNFNPVPVGIKIQFDGASAPIFISSFRLGGMFSICRAIRSVWTNGK